MPRYVATINVPGYLPMDDEPPVFDTADEAWVYLMHERRHGEDSAQYGPNDPDADEYSDTMATLEYIAGGEHQHGNPHEDTPTNADRLVHPFGGCKGLDARCRCM